MRVQKKKYRDWRCIYLEGNVQWMKSKFSTKYERCSKSIETEAVCIKREMNNERNVNFHQNARFVQKVATETVFTKTKMNNEWNVNFLQNTKFVQKASI